MRSYLPDFYILAGVDIWINGGEENPGFDQIPRNFIFLGVGAVLFSPVLVRILMADVGRKVFLAPAGPRRSGENNRRVTRRTTI